MRFTGIALESFLLWDGKWSGHYRWNDCSRKDWCTPEKFDRARTVAALISSSTCCHSVGCVTTARLQSATQSDTHRSTAGHMMRWVVFAIREATRSKRTNRIADCIWNFSKTLRRSFR